MATDARTNCRASRALDCLSNYLDYSLLFDAVLVVVVVDLPRCYPIVIDFCWLNCSTCSLESSYRPDVRICLFDSIVDSLARGSIELEDFESLN